MADILFTCAGTTDPVRGGYDGGMLHILRHYRPEGVYLFLSAEMAEYEDRDQRFQKMFHYMQSQWGYSPQCVCERSGIRDVSDLDAVCDPLRVFFRRAAEENPGCRILINLSSGTPQMKIVLAQLALSVGRSVLGIQVSNPERRSGSSSRSNDRTYVVDDELQLNEDDEPGAVSRCSQPQMLAMQQEQQRAQIRSLLKRRDYDALETLSPVLPPQLAQLAQHLAARSRLQGKEAARLARGLKLPFELYYPLEHGTDSRYKELTEYYLLLRNLQLSQRYTEFVLRINPFLSQLMLPLVERGLPCPLKSIVEQRPGNRICLNPETMAQHVPELLRAMQHELGSLLEPGKDFSLYIGVALLKAMNELPAVINKLPADLLALLDACNKLNQQQRNPAAHQLHAVTEEGLRTACEDSQHRHYSPAELVNGFSRLLYIAFDQAFNRKLFSVYDQCEGYFLQQL